LGRDFAAQIPGAKYIEYPGVDHAFWSGEVEALLGDIEEFITGHRETESADLERILATVLFTDIVDSTRRAAEMGDQNWRRLLDSHDQLARQTVERHRGNLIKNTGDGFSPPSMDPVAPCVARWHFWPQPNRLACRCVLACTLEKSRSGGHDIGGIAVHAAARVMANSEPEEVLVSRVVSDLVAGQD